MAGLSQRLLDRLSGIGLGVLGDLVETITYTAKSDPAAEATTHTLRAQLGDYRVQDLLDGTILRQDRRCRVRTADVTWQPLPGDVVTRSNGTEWLVLNVSDGPGRPWYFFQLRQVG